MYWSSWYSLYFRMPNNLKSRDHVIQRRFLSLTFAFCFSEGAVPLNHQLESLLNQILDKYGSHVKGQSNSDKLSNSFKRRSGSLGYGGITWLTDHGNTTDQRITNVRNEIKGLIGPARQSVAEDIAKANRDNVLLALVNFLGGAGIKNN